MTDPTPQPEITPPLTPSPEPEINPGGTPDEFPQPPEENDGPVERPGAD